MILRLSSQTMVDGLWFVGLGELVAVCVCVCVNVERG
jgi:hypothetical protein